MRWYRRWLLLALASARLCAQNATGRFDHHEVSISIDGQCGSTVGRRLPAATYSTASISFSFDSAEASCPGLTARGTVEVEAKGDTFSGSSSGGAKVTPPPAVNIRYAATFTRTSSANVYSYQHGLYHDVYTIGGEPNPCPNISQPWGNSIAMGASTVTHSQECSRERIPFPTRVEHRLFGKVRASMTFAGVRDGGGPNNAFVVNVEVLTFYRMEEARVVWEPATLEIPVPAGGPPTSKTVKLRNAGGHPMTWRLPSTSEYPSFSPTTGPAIPPGQSTDITVTVNPGSWSPGTRQAYSLSCSCNAWFEQPRLPITMVVEPGRDSLRITDSNPRAGTPLQPASQVSFEATVAGGLFSRGRATLQLRAYDQDGTLRAASQGTASVSTGPIRAFLVAAPMRIEEGIRGASLRAALVDVNDASLILESEPILYDVAGARDTIRFEDGSLSPDPSVGLTAGGSLGFSAGVRFQLVTRSDAWLALRLFDQAAGGVLQRSSEFELVERGDGEQTRTIRIPAFELPKDFKPVYLKAVLIDRLLDRVVAETAAIQYEFGEDLSVGRVEVVQVVQDERNSVPLVARKSTVVRIFPLASTSGPSVSNVTVRLHGRDAQGNPLPNSPLTASNRVVSAKASVDRNSAVDSFDVYLPAAWVAKPGQIELEAELESPSSFRESDRENNRKSIRVTLTEVLRPGEKLRIGYVPVCYQPPGAERAECPSAGIGQVEGMVRKLYPVPDDGVKYFRIPTPDYVYRRLLRRETQDRLKTALRRAYLANDKLRTEADQVAFWIPIIAAPPDPPGGKRPAGGSADALWSGADRTGRFFWGQDLTMAGRPLAAARLLAHEIGHNLGLRHTSVGLYGLADGERCDPSQGQTDWKYANAQIQEPGFDPSEAAFKANAKYELMSYCLLRSGDVWISPLNYGKLFDARLQPSTALVPKQEALRTATAPAPYLLVSGSARRDGSAGQLDPAFRITSGEVDAELDPNGNHCLTFHGPAGALASYCFNLSFENLDTDQEADVLEEESFALKILLSAGATKVVLRRGDRELAFLETGRPPSLTIMSPIANTRWQGRQTISWTASNPDGRALTYIVQYSSDGGQTWLPLATDISETQLAIDAAQVEAGKDTFIRVLATNGFDTASAIVGPIEVAQSARLAMTPAGDIEYRKVMLGASVDRSFTVRNTGDGPLHIASLEIDREGFRVLSPRSDLTLAPGEERAVTVRFEPVTEAVYAARLTLLNNTSQPRMEVLLGGRGIARSAPDMEVSPAALDFGPVAAGQSRELSITVRNHGPGGLTVSAIRGATGSFTLVSPAPPFTLQAGVEQQVKVRFAPTAGGAHSTTLTIAGDDPDRGEVSVPLRGTSPAPVSSPSIRATPATLDFGDVTPGQTKDLTLTVSNPGGAVLSVSAVAFSNPVFRLASPSAPFSVAGAEQALTIRFAPAAPGRQTSTITLSSNDPAMPSLVVNASGNGIAAAPGRTLVLSADDNDFDQVLGLPGRNATLVNRLTPPSYPATLKSVQIFFPLEGLPVGQTVTVVVAPHPSGSADLRTPSFRSTAHRIQATQRWSEIAVDPLIIESGDFLVGFVAFHPPGVFPVLYDTTNYRQRSYFSVDGVNFPLVHSVSGGRPGNFGIRAVVEMR